MSMLKTAPAVMSWFSDFPLYTCGAYCVVKVFLICCCRDRNKQSSNWILCLRLERIRFCCQLYMYRSNTYSRMYIHKDASCFCLSVVSYKSFSLSVTP